MTREWPSKPRELCLERSESPYRLVSLRVAGAGRRLCEVTVSDLHVFCHATPPVSGMDESFGLSSLVYLSVSYQQILVILPVRLLLRSA